MTTEAEQVLVVDLDKPLGKLKALHGVCNGPYVLGSHTANMAKLHAEAAFPHVRLHDCHWPNPNVVDVPCIFPLFHADPDDPANYVFAPTDDYLEAIVKNGSQIIYRLGVSIEHKTAYYIHPPKDFGKWSKICVNIIRHCNDGWANGFRHNIRYWEIWNEAEGNAMWRGTRQQYFNLYEIAAKAIKAHDPKLKVGGPAACDAESEYSAEFVAFCRTRQLPLDFYSWHIYTDSPKQLLRKVGIARKLLDEKGFVATESHMNEWRPIIDGRLSAKDGQPPTTVDGAFPAARDGQALTTVEEAFARNRNHESAAFAANVLMQLQDAPLDVANYYTADDSPWSMFNEFGVPGKVFFAFKAFRLLLDCPNRLAVEGALGTDEVSALAGISDDRQTAAFMVSNYRGQPRQLVVKLKGLPPANGGRMETFLVDETHELEKMGDEPLDGANPVVNLRLPPGTVWLVKLKHVPPAARTRADSGGPVSTPAV